MTDVGRVGDAETGSRASTEPASSLRPTGFDPARMSNPWREMVDAACADARQQAHEGAWIVDGLRADNLGAQAMQLVADRTGLSVIVADRSDYHEGKTFSPAIAAAARRGET